MNSFVLPVIVSTVSAVPAVLFALWLGRLTSRRAMDARLGEYADPGRAPSGLQPWRDAFYDIRDWASCIHAYLAHGNARTMDFSFIRIPGHHFIEHLVTTNRVPEEHLQQVIILREYCELLANALAQVLADDLRAARRIEVRPLDQLRTSVDDVPDGPEAAVAQLAVAVREMASELADPAAARRPQQHQLAEMFRPRAS
jgi:hypothetical protein